MYQQSHHGRVVLVAAAILFTLAVRVAPAQQKFQVLVNFDGTNGAESHDGFVQGLDGNLYGTTNAGGPSTFCMFGCGTVFKMTATGTLTTIYHFCLEAGCTDGALPNASLAQEADGTFYGTTQGGGTGHTCFPYNPCGTVFKISPSGKLTTIHDFVSTDGYSPFGGLVRADSGIFYGTTSGGGANGQGTVFSITPTGVLSTLYNFCAQPNCTDGYSPFSGLVQTADGNFYGTTIGGGANGPDAGTVFKMTPTGALTTIYSFCAQTNCADGSAPNGLVQGVDENLYGTTAGGGAFSSGTVFKISLAGALSTLYSFCAQANCTDGNSPISGLMQATDGSLYGTTAYGGADNACNSGAGCGTVFRISPEGALTTLHSFQGIDGAEPEGVVFQATDGAIFGTSFFKGTDTSCDSGNGCGTAFRLSLGLHAFVETLPGSGKVGQRIDILGSNLVGATGVTFNGAPSSFTVVSGTLIKATVPTGATSGPIRVVTPSGTLTSNLPFRVIG